ncbi:hypothetical protein [Geoalkalibacter halelectricus]|uniref:Uncharacterized protein n=1 Tax=Geoalkalibacter halelectricus TaxID=2847045 RepID=A0ABY5ZQE2_9BACT|nr:hypothetical protein [Geoalkalibacter halelectricus]MDO3376732.1 hypothetical protein [Geoalkalibacter halelectricus]UWZ81316.1 hypothetical protein L9S41_07975 [Geoalkalibacter halelectricus]
MGMLLLALLLLIGGCGSGDSNEGAATTRNAHEPGWRFTHDTPTLLAQSRGDLSECQVCHRADFRGGGGVPSCFVCHLGGPPFDLHHEAGWDEPDLPWAHPLNHGRAAKRDIASCQGCHGESGGPGSNPRFDISMRDLPGGCESLMCHDNGRVNTFVDTISGDPLRKEVAHPALAAHPGSSAPDHFWWFGQRLEFPDGRLANLGHWDVGNLQACTLCHGVDGLGGSGPSCLECHVSNPFVHPDGCVSCHGPPPMPFTGTKVDDYIAQTGRVLATFRADFFDLIDQGYHLGFGHQFEDEYAQCQRCHFDDPDFVPPDPIEDPEGFQEYVEDPNRIVNRHHFLIGATIPINTVAPNPPNQPGQTYDCSSCHTLVLVDGQFDFTIPQIPGTDRTDCGACHQAR